MGKVFGQLAYVRNIIYVRLSPFEQKAFAGFWANSWRGLKRDFFNNAPYIFPRKLPPLLRVRTMLEYIN